MLLAALEGICDLALLESLDPRNQKCPFPNLLFASIMIRNDAIRCVGQHEGELPTLDHEGKKSKTSK